MEIIDPTEGLKLHWAIAGITDENMQVERETSDPSKEIYIPGVLRGSLHLTLWGEQEANLKLTNHFSGHTPSSQLLVSAAITEMEAASDAAFVVVHAQDDRTYDIFLYTSEMYSGVGFEQRLLRYAMSRLSHHECELNLCMRVQNASDVLEALPKVRLLSCTGLSYNEGGGVVRAMYKLADCQLDLGQTSMKTSIPLCQARGAFNPRA